jgi:peroxiredoxin
VHCRDHAVQLHRARERFQAAGAVPVLIGMGTPRQASWFRGRFAPDLTVLADEERRSYKAAGLKVASVGELLGPKSVVTGIKHAARSGVMQGKPTANPAQLGGALVVGPGGEVRFEHRSANAGDSAEPDVLLAALSSAG